MAPADRHREQHGTEEHGQASEFVDVPENLPGDQDDPPPSSPPTTGEEQAAENRENDPPA